MFIFTNLKKLIYQHCKKIQGMKKLRKNMIKELIYLCD